MAKLTIVEGIGPVFEKKLKDAGVNSIESLLKTCATKKARAELAKKTDILEETILTWVNHADLMRIKGIGGEYSELLEAAGVDTVPELSKRNGDNLYEKIVEVNGAKKLVRKLPAKKQVLNWIEQAKKLPRAIQY
jgi:predicted flap endonuclease-1-like 5' DNA nuclease